LLPIEWMTTWPELIPTRREISLFPTAIQLANAGLHCDRRATGLHGMVFGRNGRSKKRHNAVATRLVHKPIVPMNPIHQHLKHRSEDFERLFWIEPVDQRCRATNVGEQNRDVLAFS
jgi:hypothetical protein